MKLIKPTFVISTRADNLARALKESPKTITVWVRSGKFKDKFPLIRSVITYQVKSIIDAKDYQKRFISTLPIPCTHIKLSVLKGVSNNEIRQLLLYTKTDKLIRTSTHDIDCFRSKKTFMSWMRRGKVIYALIDRKGKLMAAIWFNKGVRTTRIYPPARGKKFVKKFSDIVGNDFGKGTQKSAVPKNRKS